MIKVGIIGFGRMGITHYSIINQNTEIEVTAIVDNSDLNIKLLSKYKKNLKLYKDYNTFFSNENCDAIIVCTPPLYHYEIVKQAFMRNMHVFIEKPFTINSIQASELCELYSKSDFVNQVGYVNRFNAVFHKANEIIKNGIIGDLISFKSNMYSNTISKTNEGESTWRDNLESGGGALFEMASHSIDLINYLIGVPDKVVGSILKKVYSKNVEDIVITNFIYKNGIIGSLNVNWSESSYRKPTNNVEISGTLGKIIADQHCMKIFLKKSLPNYNLHDGWNTIYITDIFNPVNFYVRGNEFSNQLDSFVECIILKKKSKCQFIDGKHVLETIEKIRSDYNTNNKL